MRKNSRTFSARTAAIVLLAVATSETRATAVVPLNFESVNYGRLAALADELRADVARSATDGGAAEVRTQFWTSATQDPATAAGCGYAFLVNDDASGLSAHVPRYERAACGGGGGGGGLHRYRVQFVRPDAMYEAAVTVTGQPVRNVTVTSNGGDGLLLDTVCVGYSGVRDGSGDRSVRAFCVNRLLLEACFGLFGECPRDVIPSLGAADDRVRLSRAFEGSAERNCKEIGFLDVDGVARGLEELKQNATDGLAQIKVCSNISLSAQSSAWAIDAAKCYAVQEDEMADGGGGGGGEFIHVKIRADHVRDNCTRT